VVAVDRKGHPLPGACFTLEGASRSVASACDADDGHDDGTTTFAGVPGGTYTLSEDAAPADHAAVNDRTVEVRPGKRTTVRVKHSS